MNDSESELPKLDVELIFPLYTSLRATVSDRNLRLQKVLAFIFKHFQPELVEKLARIGLKDIIGKSNWERAQEDHERSQSQEIRRGLKL
jgi:hypothetical protein